MKKRRDKLEKSGVNVKDVAACRKGLLNGFVWDNTKEGYAYWSKIHDRLYAIERWAKKK